MFVWMLALRRVKSVVAALLIGLAVTFVAWAAIGFDGLSGYPGSPPAPLGASVGAELLARGHGGTLGLDPIVGKVATLVVGGALLVGCIVLARRGDEPRSFTCAVAATLALSPIVWLHYLVALLVPLAIVRPRFSWIWLLPVLLWVSPKPGYAEGFQTFVPALAAAILIAVILGRSQGPDLDGSSAASPGGDVIPGAAAAAGHTEFSDGRARPSPRVVRVLWRVAGNHGVRALRERSW